MRAVYTLAAAAVVFAAAVLLPLYTADRPAGGFVTGNEAAAGAGAISPRVDLGAVTDERLEAVVAANPTVVGMRLALADRYVAERAYDRAVRHYTQALALEPDNPEALAHFAWLLLQIDQPRPALEYVDRALVLQG